MKRVFALIIISCAVMESLAQKPDTTRLSEEKRTKWLAGVDGLSALHFVSVIGGLEKGHSRFSLSLSSLQGSSRVGVYYDHYITKKYRVLAGIGFHNSFLFKEFKKTRTEYLDSLIENNTEGTLGNGAFLPNAAEVRHQYFLSLSVGKEFKLIKGLFVNVKLSGLLVINPFYNKMALGGIYGLQLYYKW